MSVELPKDAEGREIPLDTVVLFGGNRSLENMSLCHAAKVWENARGCRIEHDAAVAYGLEVLYED